MRRRDRWFRVGNATHFALVLGWRAAVSERKAQVQAGLTDVTIREDR